MGTTARRRLAAARTLVGPRWAFWLYDATVWLERAARALGVAVARRCLRLRTGDELYYR